MNFGPVLVAMAKDEREDAEAEYKSRSGFPSGMTTRKARTMAKATPQANAHRMPLR
jgi:hypothetical protein